MISKRYQNMASQIVKKVFPDNETFIFGGAARKKNYGDVDIAIRGVQNKEKLFTLYEAFEASDFPKTVDLIDFDQSEKPFTEYVLSHEKKIWI